MPVSIFEWVAASLVAVLGIARIIRLVVFDDFPPSVWFRTKWEDLTNNGPWVKLVECGFCLAPYVTAASMAWAYFSDLHWSWWLFHGWLALAYVAPIIVSYDQPD